MRTQKAYYEGTNADQVAESNAAGIDCSNLPDTARQEFAKDSDINNILAKYGIDALSDPVNFGEYDTDIDLQAGLNSLAAAKASYSRIPEHIRKRYRDWTELLTAINEGKETLDTIKDPNYTPPTPATPPVTP